MPIGLRSPRSHTVLVSILTLLLSGPALAQAQVSPDEDALTSPGRDFVGALIDSLKLVSMEHAIRVGLQTKTRSELDGPFWAEYRKSVRFPRQWEDGDSWLVNYVGHPIHGAGAGIIWLDHSDKDRAASLFGPGYLTSRAKAAAFSALYSLQFEIGPLSEASIGNVGRDPMTTGWVDYVVTPVGGFAFMIAEDALDRYLVRWIEARVRNRVARASLRLIFGPSRFLANGAGNRLPWYRPDRPLGW